MLYDFRCDECGQIREILCHSSEIIGRQETCHCGAGMRRVYYPVAATGDLPGKGNVGYYDPTLGAQITSGRQRKALMEARGLAEYSPGGVDSTIAKEAAYIRKNGGGRNAVNSMAKELTVSDRKKRQAKAVSNAVDQATRGVSD